MAAERTFWYKGLRVDVWPKSFTWTGLPFMVFLGASPKDEKIRKMIDTAQKAGNRFRPEPRGIVARFLARCRGFHKGGFMPVADERVQMFFEGRTERPGEKIIKFTGPPVTREMQQLFGGYAGHGRVTGIIQLAAGIRVSYENGEDVLFAPVARP